MSVEPNTSISKERANKRKLDDVLQSLDDALERPQKRPHLVHTLYSTLAKYGIKTKDSAPTTSSDVRTADLSKTPHLAAILARAAAKTRKALPSNLLERLATYKLNTYSNKPSAIDAVAAARCGWVNDGKDRLVCGICKASWVLAGREGMNRDAASVLVEKQRVQLVDMHKDGCPWKKRQCDADVYRIPLSSPAAMAKEIKTRARTLESILEGIEIKHPLSSTQVQGLLSVIASVEESSAKENTGETFIQKESPPPGPSSNAVLTSLFGWSLVPSNGPSPQSTIPSPYWSRASSVAPTETCSAPPLPLTPRRPSRRSSSTTQTNTPIHLASLLEIPTSPRGSVAPDRRRDTSLLHCSLCHRRLGLWAIISTPRASRTAEDSPAVPPKARQIDLLREHRPYCPYVVRSTTIPSLPVAPANAAHTRAPSSTPSFTSFLSSSSASQVDTQRPAAVEGWRAVLMVVLRYRMGQWQRRKVSKGVTDGELDKSIQQSTASPVTAGYVDEESWLEVDPVEAMVEGVKSSGGSELLKYIKGLLG
ncbi:zf-C3HC-domain-containing protein [Lactarius pseudohatsudake]|nr:zf-C3HC-domain-containing protein [Lactarius pseudohatsudake]